MNTDILHKHSTLDRHLGPVQNEPVFPAGNSMSVRAREEGSSDASDAYLCSYAKKLAVTLNDLLNRYVDLLESSEHGGWSRAEDQMVQSVRLLLSQSRLLP